MIKKQETEILHKLQSQAAANANVSPFLHWVGINVFSKLCAISQVFSLLCLWLLKFLFLREVMPFPSIMLCLMRF